jgi:hypothetical protein
MLSTGVTRAEQLPSRGKHQEFQDVITIVGIVTSSFHQLGSSDTLFLRLMLSLEHVNFTLTGHRRYGYASIDLIVAA